MAEFYDQLKDEEGQEDSLEIIFASSDHDENSFEEYYRSQPWVSMPYENQTAIRALGQKYGVRGIPSFIILKGNDGTIIDSDGRGTVIQSRGDTTKVLSKWLN